MAGTWKSREGLYARRYLDAKEMITKFTEIRFSWVPREENHEADSLSRVGYERGSHVAESSRVLIRTLLEISWNCSHCLEVPSSEVFWH